MPDAIQPPPTAAAELAASAGRACQFLKSLANPNRLMILCALVDEERSVGELERLLGLRQPSLSQQLALLREEGFVLARREGKSIRYRLGRPEVSEVLTLLHKHFC